MADRSVILRFLSDTTGLKRGFAEVGQGAQESEGVFARLEGKLSGIGTSGVAAAAGFAGVATSVVAFATEAVKRLGEEQVAAAQTAAAIMSTGDASNVTAAHVHTLAESLGKLSGVDHEVIQSGENILLTMTNIKNGVGAGNDVFDQATKAALNMSVALGEDMTAASTQLGKALNDPVAGLVSLHRVGVQFTADQKKAIAAFVASGDVMSAQKIILDELNVKFAGSAEAYGKTLPGAIGKAKTAIADWSASVAQDALPAIETFVSKVADIAKVIGPPVIAALKGVGDVIVSVGKFAKDHAGYVIAAAAAYTASLIPAVWAAVAAFGALAFAKVASTIDLVVTSVRVLALEMGVLRLALLSTGIGVAVVLLGSFISALQSGKQHADALVASASKGLDLSTWGGLADQQKNLGGLIAANTAQFEKFGSTGRAVARDVIEIANPFGHNVVNDNVQGGKAIQAALDANVAKMHQYNQNIDVISTATGLNRQQVEALAQANQIDLSSALDTTTQKIIDQHNAAVEATKGWVGYGVSVEDAVAIQKEITAAFEAAADPVKVYAAALTATQNASKDSNKAQADSIKGQAQAARDALTARHDAETAALAGEFITGKASQAAHDQRVKALVAQQTAENKAADATVASEGKRATAIENTKAQTSLSMAEYQKAVDANTKATTAWMTNLALIGGRPGGAEVEGMLAKLGPGQAGLVAQVLKSDPKAFDSFVKTMHDAGKTATDETELELDKLPGEVQTIAQTSGQTFADTLVHQVAIGLKPLSAVVAAAAADALAAAFTASQVQAAADVASIHDKNEGAAAGMGGLAAPTISSPGTPTAASGPGAPFSISNPTGYPIVIGGHAEGHFAQIVPAGDVRVWAEPETGGEAYIPLAASKRAGSMAIIAQVANAFGQRLVPMAAGGTWGVAVGGAGGAGGGGQGTAVAALERAVATLTKTSSQRRTVELNNTFHEKVDPLHVARKIAWALT